MKLLGSAFVSISLIMTQSIAMAAGGAAVVLPQPLSVTLEEVISVGNSISFSGSAPSTERMIAGKGWIGGDPTRRSIVIHFEKQQFSPSSYVEVERCFEIAQSALLARHQSLVSGRKVVFSIESKGMRTDNAKFSDLQVEDPMSTNGNTDISINCQLVLK